MTKYNTSMDYALSVYHGDNGLSVWNVYSYKNII